jgi:hypothetical protein
MHDHIEPKDCNHELQYCKKCDVVYCEVCGKEWKIETVYIYQGITTTYPPYPNTTPYPNNPNIPWVTYTTPNTTAGTTMNETTCRHRLK